MKKDNRFCWLPGPFGQHGVSFRLIHPTMYSHHGIDPRDIPMGTFAAEDHPSFLPSRLGGNAYGLGLIEQSALSRTDTDFLESLDFDKPDEVARNAGRLNLIHRKLGLLIRFTSTGKRYYLIPINLVAHSLQDIKMKADEVEALVERHVAETNKERLDIGIMTSGHDLAAHELTARLSNHRIFLLETLDKIRSWRAPLDVIVLPKDIFEHLLDQSLPKGSRRSPTRQRLFSYGAYLAGKIFDILKPDGRFVMLAYFPHPEEDAVRKVHFKSEEELKSFLFFSHVFKTRGSYSPADDALEAYVSDLCYYMQRLPYSDAQLKRLLGDRKPESLTIQEINALSYLNARLPRLRIGRLRKQWEWIFSIYFESIETTCKSPGLQREYWEKRLEMEGEIPESLWLFVGRSRQPSVSASTIEDELRSVGMLGCSLPLVAEYRDSFRYVLDVLKIVNRIRENDFPKLTELERIRLSNPFNTKSEGFGAVARLLGQIPKLEKIEDYLNPDHIEGQGSPILENIPKLALHGFTPAQLRELLLIVVGHTTMSRIVFGKLPAKTLKPITDKAKKGEYQEIVKTLRTCRLMSMAQIAAALGDAFTAEQAKELFLLYDDAIQVATEPELDWDRLEDLRISALGGVQNKAIREMLKFFNLFEFLNNWMELKEKGPLQREVLCDYSSVKLKNLEKALDLAETAVRLQEKAVASHRFGRSYFFRQFLDAEFHGTGHLFPKLGTRAGFMLLWLTLNAAQRRIVNFNPMLAQTPRDRSEQRVSKIKEVLLQIPIERLKPELFNELKKTLTEGLPAFVFDTGIRLVCNSSTHAVDVSFVDVDENIQLIEGLLTHFESQKLHGISLRSLQRMERLFSELESFSRYLHQEGAAPDREVVMKTVAGDIAHRAERTIEGIEARLKELLLKQIFIPEDIYDNVSALAENCPEILRFVLPELHDLGNLVERWPTQGKASVGIYTMHCLKKFQALITKDRDAFQDRDAFYKLAKFEFGPLAEEGTGVGAGQMEILERIVERIQQRPLLYQALTIALLFQEIGKIEKYACFLPDLQGLITHAGDGAAIIESQRILEGRFDSGVHSLVAQLIRRHGAIGYVLQGEEPATVLEHLVSEKDDRLLDAYVLHAILAAASVEEGLMTSDLLDQFLSYRNAAAEVLESGETWLDYLRKVLRGKGESALLELDPSPGKLRERLSEEAFDCGFPDDNADDPALRRGRLMAAMERLLRLAGAPWVNYEDLRMHLLRTPTNFIYHKKRLKSIGLPTFEKQLGTAVKTLEAISALHPEPCHYILYCLDHLGFGMRVYDFQPLTDYMEMAECIQLLYASFQAFHQYFGIDEKNGCITFRQLSQVIKKRRTAIRGVLQNMPKPEGCHSDASYTSFSHPYGALRFETEECNGRCIVRVVFQDAAPIDEMTQSLLSLESHAELLERRRDFMDELKALPYDAGDYQAMLTKAYRRQHRKINDKMLKSFQEQLDSASNFYEFHLIQEEIEEKQIDLSFSEEQQFLLKDFLEFHRARIRDQYLERIYQRMESLESKDALLQYWEAIKYELLDYRPYVGKEYESLIAEFVEQKTGAWPTDRTY
ncbi:MAG: hypothetical protein AB7W37_03545 [Syntrophobacteraceae bacterium]